MSDMMYFQKMPGKRRDFYVIVLNLNHLKSIGMAVVLGDGPGELCLECLVTLDLRLHV